MIFDLIAEKGENNKTKQVQWWIEIRLNRTLSVECSIALISDIVVKQRKYRRLNTAHLTP